MKLLTRTFGQSLVLLMMLICASFSAQSQARDLPTIKAFTDGMLKVEGFYNFYYDKKSGQLYLELDRQDEPFLFQSSLPQGLGSNDIGLDRGQLGATRIVQFEAHGNKVLMTQINTRFRANSDNRAEQQSVKEAFAKSVLHGFKIEAKLRGTILINYTPFLLSDIHGVASRLKARNQGSYSLAKDRSAVQFAQSKSFPKNTELEAIVSFKGSKPGQYVRQVAPDPLNLTVAMHHSLIALPDDNYTPREFHPFSGFWNISHYDYAAQLDESMQVNYIPRHRVSDKEPIIYYLDPGTPEPIRTALIDGAMWWNDAFKAAGYKNAFQVKMLPPHADPMDVRYNTIQWVHRATRGWSYGGSITDPRTGEIIKGHVTLGSLRVRHDYLLGQGLTAPFGEDGSDQEITAMALARIRQLSAHEVGHTLGIAHNFAASANDRASVMDYPHPLVEVKDGKLDLSNAYREGIGEWDIYAIKYGYQKFGGQQQTKAGLNKLITEAKKQGLQYMSDSDARPMSGAHPTGHLWDNGKDAAAELRRVLEVRKFALNQFGLDNLAANRPLSDLQEVLMPIYFFHRYQTEAASKLIGGVNYEYIVKEGKLGADSKPVQAVSAEQQKQALTTLLMTLDPEVLALPESIINLIPPKAMGYYRNRESGPTKMGLVFDPLTLSDAAANHTLNGLLNKARLSRIAHQASMNSEHLDVGEYLQTIISKTIKSAPSRGQANLVSQRVASLTLEHLGQLITDVSLPVEIRAILFSELSQLNEWFKLESLNSSSGKRSFYRLASHHLDWYFKHREWLPLTDKTNMPPGSPI